MIEKFRLCLVSAFCLLIFHCSSQKLIETEPEEFVSENEKIASVFDEKVSVNASNFYLKKAIAEYLGRGRWERAIRSYIRLGNGYVKNKDYDSALHYLNKGLQLAVTHSGYEYSRLARSYHRIAFGYLREKKYLKAIVLYKKALELKRKIYGKYHSEISKTYNSISLAYRNMGEEELANKFYYRSLVIKLKRFEKIDEGFFRTFKFSDRMNIKKRLFSEAKKVLGRSLKVYLETFGGYNNLTAVIFENIGIIYAVEGSFDRAIKNIRNALDIREKLFGEGSLEVADSFHDLGVTLQLRGDLAESGKYLKQALGIKISKTGTTHLFTADTYFQLGKIYYKQGKIDDAILMFQNSLFALDRRFRPDDPGYTPDMGTKIDFKIDILNVLVSRAKALIARADSNNNNRNDLEKAFASLMSAIKLNGFLREQTLWEDYAEKFNAFSRDIFNRSMDLAFRLYRELKSEKYLNAAFRISEKSKASILRGMINDTRAKKFSDIPPGLLRKERDLNSALADLQLSIEKAKLESVVLNSLKLSRLEKLFYDKKRELILLQKKFETGFRNYYSYRYRDKVAEIDTVMKNLSGDKAIVEYFLSKAFNKPHLPFINNLSQTIPLREYEGGYGYVLCIKEEAEP